MLRQRNHELALLNRAGQMFNSTLDLDQVLVVVLDEVRSLMDVVACSVWLIEPETGGLVCQQATDPRSDIVRGWRLAPGEGIAGWVARHGESLIVPDTWADERYFGGVEQRTGLALRSILSVPLQIRQKMIGVLEIVDVGSDRFKPADLALAEPRAAAVAIENARLRAAERERRRIAETLHQASTVLSSTLELDEVLRLMLQQLRRVIPHDSASVQRLRGECLEVVACQGIEKPDDAIGLVYPLDLKYPNYHVITARAPFAIEDVIQDYPHFEDEAAIYQTGHIRSWLGVPLMVEDQVIGMIALDRAEVRPYAVEESELAMTFANQAAVAIENAWLYEDLQRRMAEL